MSEPGLPEAKPMTERILLESIVLKGWLAGAYAREYCFYCGADVETDYVTGHQTTTHATDCLWPLLTAYLVKD